jgi:hypothetical protein
MTYPLVDSALVLPRGVEPRRIGLEGRALYPTVEALETCLGIGPSLNRVAICSAPQRSTSTVLTHPTPESAGEPGRLPAVGPGLTA